MINSRNLEGSSLNILSYEEYIDCCVQKLKKDNSITLTYGYGNSQTLNIQEVVKNIIEQLKAESYEVKDEVFRDSISNLPSSHMITIIQNPSIDSNVSKINDIQLSIFKGPTERYLEKNPIKTILESLNHSVLEKKLEFLLGISKKETEKTFFAYHGMSQKNRISQDILRAVLEELLHFELPKEFYFLRAPGLKHWDLETSKENFLEKFNKREMPEEYKKLILENLFALIEKEQQIKLDIEYFSKEEQSILWNYFQAYLQYNVNSVWNKQALKYCIPIDYNLRSENFNEHLSSLADLLEKKISENCSNGDSKSFRPWLEKKFSDDYDVGTLFQLRYLKVEEKIYRDIDSFFMPFDDTSRAQQMRLVSLNVALFANYQTSGCFTPEIVLENESVLGGDKHLKKELETFFEELGIDSSLVTLLWDKGEKILEETTTNQGCLLQFYDESANLRQKPLSFVDENVFVSMKHALPFQDLVPSKYIQGDYSLSDNSRDLELRMIMNNKTTLNPFSPLRMVRYDGSSQEDSSRILLTMKEILKNCQKDEVKLKKFRDILLNLWKI